MFETGVTGLLGIERPLIGGCMQHISGPEFTAAVSEAGALGIMSSAMYPTLEEFRDAVRRLKSLTDRPYAVNLNLFPALRPIDNELYAEVVIDEGVPVVETSGHLPPAELVRGLREAGVTVMHKCTAVRHAMSAVKQGVDAVTLFGSEGGGHIADFGFTTVSLVPRAVDVLEVPVIAAGGIADGRGLLAALALGAGAAMLGTRLLLSEVADLHRNLKEALLAASEYDTVPILGSVHNTLRAWSNAAALKAAGLEAAGVSFEEILPVVAGAATRRMMDGGDVQAGVVACGFSIGIISEIKPVAEIIDDITRQAEDIAAVLNSGRVPAVRGARARPGPDQRNER